ncbi:hypothetical protein DTO164E3_1046 [Paecilomyces variotii]|nr:hypothetical protein DTO032I3_3710 [Paecilomyces variotii]KAJ9205793.1 hypothetical protein DTO164E3_1046 [Paecilomyces variotii]KAJ9275269.1 hypothetical protein DTO021D3_7915 [Paecilomyces variotii]KAJ9339682.1 hypothetical protein DTO027B6_7809 [Paecilomyces variotii]KAJ9373007.1 hypothetical protein DTO282E5_2417 [Paecilomyces variotii]
MEDGSEQTPVGRSVDSGELLGRPRSGSANSTGHRRSLSGSLLAKLSFLRMSQTTDTSSGKDADVEGDDGDGSLPTPRPKGRALATAIQQQRRTRRRKGSLRKTALLGTRFESREKRLNNGSPRSLDVSRGDSNGYSTDNTSRRSPVSPTSLDDEATPRGSFDGDDGMSASGWSRVNTRRNSNLLGASTTPSRLQPNVSSSILGDETTTDDEDIIPFPRLANSTIRGASTSSGTGAAAAGVHIPTPSSSSDSYFPLRSESMSRQHRAGHRPKSPLATHSSDLKSVQDIWDYSETEWWGWIILIVTWIVFVIGMGSCFGVWSWAWDVGETPYAPPELEDDPTLPIVGYYPALMVCTAVMAWVWVVVAWVGMKYFKHANISGEDI